MIESSTEQITVPEDALGERLDVFLAEVLSSRYSRSQLKKMIEDGRVSLQGRSITAHYKIKPGEVIEVSHGVPPDMSAQAEDIPLDILYEDDDLIVVNKAAGMVVHPAQGNYEHTLVNALLYHVTHLSASAGTIRPGIVHRLDKDTSGVMVVAKNDRAHNLLARQFKAHTIERVYNAVVQGFVEHDEGICEEPVGRAYLNRKKIIIRPTGGKDAKTLYRVVKRFSKATLLEIRPFTGRTHQIRVHMRYIGHPVFGDSVYGTPSPWIKRQALHAKYLGFKHPTHRQWLSFDTQLPKDMQRLLRQLESTP